jgi:hypothetical protein
MSEARERTRPGCRMAIVWPIIPPSEAPTICADSTSIVAGSADLLRPSAETADGVHHPLRPRVARPSAGIHEEEDQR